MGFLNQVTLIGNLGRDPEVRKMQTGDIVANFSLATSKHWKDKDTDEKKEATEWHRVSVFNQQAAKFAEEYMKKGQSVMVQGELRTRKWTDEKGVERYTTEIVVSSFGGQVQLMEKKSSNLPPAAESEADYGNVSTKAQNDNEAALAAQAANAVDGNAALDDEIPF